MTAGPTPPTGWLVIASLPAGERRVVLPPNGQPLDDVTALDLARMVDWHDQVQAVGEAVPVWHAIDDPTGLDGDWAALPAPAPFPVADLEPVELPPPGPPAVSQVFYIVDGEPHAGTVADYVHAHQLAALDVVDVPDWVFTWRISLLPYAPGGVMWGWSYHRVEVEITDHDDDTRTVILRLLGQQAEYQHPTR